MELVGVEKGGEFMRIPKNINRRSKRTIPDILTQKPPQVATIDGGPLDKNAHLHVDARLLLDKQ